MVQATAFAESIRARYPEGLTGAFAVGGTRTTYILEYNRQNANPGKIQDFSDYTTYLLKRYLDFIRLFMELGGQNMIITALGYQSFHERGNDYAQAIAESTLALIGEEAQRFYQQHGIDPYFAGIDTLLQLPPEDSAHQLGAGLSAFQQQWPYQDGRRKVIWEIAVIPLFSFWRAPQVMSQDDNARLEAALAGATTMEAMYQALYQYYARAAYGTEIPIPHFYLGSNRNGDMKLRSLLPIVFGCGKSLRLFYTPYPSLFITRQAFQAVVEDVAFGKPILSSSQKDYNNRYTPELAEDEYQRFLEQSQDAEAIVGLTRSVKEV